ncbi:MarR family transcriptional regulator [Tardiphaga alba]|uniref:MarR family transcriptional regulator n=1 Tax=Tardiphaga alba TaxID=340268 RepID=A0ABX8ABB7_9BRAD|nr:MarR family winged helix-turn-helix transcriptional regulator [Tardiphaga alba]QUS41069.1 MarR family transcriptional regulator [Tardiphaga alba]
MSRSRVAPLASASGSRKSKSKLPVPSLTTSRSALLTNGSDLAFRQLVHTLLAFLARHETVRENYAAAIGLTGIEYTVLISTKSFVASGAVSVRELAAHLHLSGAFVTTISNKLQEMGLLDKLVDPEDRRRLRLVVTAAGDALLASLAPIECQVNDIQFDALGAGDVGRLLASVDKLVASSERAIALQRYLQPATGADAVPRRAVKKRVSK